MNISKNGVRSNPLMRLRRKLQASSVEHDPTELFLAKLFYRIAFAHGLADREVGIEGASGLLYTRLLNDYVTLLENNPRRKRRKGKLDHAKRNSIRGNIQKQLTSPTMTWNVFCSGMRFLKIDKIVFHIETHSGPLFHKHDVELDFRSGEALELEKIAAALEADDIAMVNMSIDADNEG